jgi:hypothetical protein
MSLKNSVNWQTVRSLGELHILTRASYLMLILVPIMAGLWPGVRLILNRYNQAVTDSRLALEAASERLQIAASQTQQLSETSNGSKQQLAEKAAHILQEMKVQLDHVVSDYSLKTIERTSLPGVWVRAFLAALLVLVAHLIYQARCPDLVRQTSLAQYRIDMRKQCAENPSEGLINRAKMFIEKIADQYEVGYIANLQTERPSDREARRSWELDTVEMGAYAEYILTARRNQNSAICSEFLYLLAVGLVFCIAIEQILSIFRAADWI